MKYVDSSLLGKGRLYRKFSGSKQAGYANNRSEKCIVHRPVNDNFPIGRICLRYDHLCYRLAFRGSAKLIRVSP